MGRKQTKKQENEPQQERKMAIVIIKKYPHTPIPYDDPLI
jgi:hypothetical protein